MQIVDENLVFEKSYPKLKYLMKNSYYQGILQNLFGGSEGEIISIMQLIYQINFFNGDEKIGSLLKTILKHDMKHQTMLANATAMLGGDARFYDCKKKYISLKQIDYFSNIKMMIRSDIELKEKSIIDYRFAISKISNVNLKMYLERILKDEYLHLKMLKEI